MQKFILSQEEKDRIRETVRKNSAGADIQTEEFVRILTEAAENDGRFRLAIRQWLDGSNRMSDFDVHGYKFSAISSFYKNKEFGVITSLRILWDEKNGLDNICLTVGQSCIADKKILKGQRTELAIPEKDGWYFYGTRPPEKYPDGTRTEMGGYELYRICEADPALIELVTAEDIPFGECFVCRTGDNDFELFIESDD